MSDETLVLTLTKVQPAETKAGKRYHRAWDEEYLPSGYPCWSIWDGDVGSTLMAMAGQPVTVKVNRDNADFPKITKFVTVGGGAPASSPPPSQPAAARSTGNGTPAGPAAAAGAGGSNTFKRDPLGVMLNLRQTALNCATQWMVSVNEKLPAEEKYGHAHLMKCADVLFRHLVRGVEDALPIPQNGPETKDNGSATGPGGGVPDDDIPF